MPMCSLYREHTVGDEEGPMPWSKWIVRMKRLIKDMTLIELRGERRVVDWLVKFARYPNAKGNICHNDEWYTAMPSYIEVQ